MSFLSSLIEITTWRLPSDVVVEGDDIIAAGEGYRQVPAVWIGKPAGDFGQSCGAQGQQVICIGV